MGVGVWGIVFAVWGFGARRKHAAASNGNAPPPLVHCSPGRPAEEGKGGLGVGDVRASLVERVEHIAVEKSLAHRLNAQARK